MSTQDLSGGGFNFDTEAGVAHLLASVRSANISSEQKNDLRDTIFLYTNGGRDQTVRLSLEQKLASYGVKPTGNAPGAAASPSQPSSPMGFSRTAPNSFSVSATNNQPASTPPAPTQPPAQATPPPAPTQPTVQPAPAPAPTPQPPTPTPAPAQPAQQAQPTQPPQPATPASAPTPVQPAPQAPVSPQPVTPAPSTPPPPQPTPALPVAPAAKPIPQTPPTPGDQSGVSTASSQPLTGHDPAVFLDRIREIKSLVNQQVGNPVNLVDINNEVGREYMGALLDAMKKINSGASAVSAMQRLENSYKSVEKAIADHNAGAPQASTTPPAPQTPQAPATPAPAPQPPPANQPTSAQPQTPPAPQQSPAPAPAQPTPPPSPTPAPTPTPPAPAPKPTPPPPPPEPEKPKPRPEPVAPQPEPVKTEPPTPEPAKPAKPEPEKPKPITEEPASSVADKTQSRVPLQDIPNPATKAQAHKQTDKPESAEPDTTAEERWSKSGFSDQGEIAKVSSLADTLTEKKLKDTKPEDKQSPVSGDPLYTPEIDEGLNQLLTEWSLFKKSGLFGTGPKGREHPLFKKIAGLQIPLLLAGRFEGATQEIKQSITDYMNGWRYEQGIIYNQGETFERYLRRVIKHILDLQKKKTPA